ncbi:MAG: 50S ribosomal protein L22 [Janthinobacterium lividum]
MNTAARDRALLPTVKDVLGRTPVSKLKLTKEKDGSLKVVLHSSRPNTVRMELKDLTDALKEQIGASRTVSVEVVAEARAVAKYIRMSPRKARLVIDVIKGKRVSEALAMLRFIPNEAAEHIMKVVISAAANAQDGWGAGVDELKVQNILADGGPSLKRVRARAQGRAYRILKRTSHVTVILTEAPALVARPKRTAVQAPAKAKAAPGHVAPKAQTVTEQAKEEVALDTPVAAPAEETQHIPGSEQGEGSTGDSANTPDAGQSAAPAAVAETTPEPHEAKPVTASDAPEEDVSDRAPDPSDGADQKREEGE